MRKEDFVALGISEDLAEKAAEASKEEFKDYVPRTRLNEEIQKKKNAEEALSSVKSELENLKSSAGDSAALRDQIKKLQDDLKDKESKHTAEIAEMKMTNAITAALGSTARDADLVAGLLDKTKLILGDDGKVAGLDEQIKNIKESKPYLFTDDKGYPDVKDGGQPQNTGGKSSTRDQFADWLDQVVAN